MLLRIRRLQGMPTMANVLGILGISREQPGGRRPIAKTTTKKGIKVNPRFQRPGKTVFEEAGRARKK